MARYSITSPSGERGTMTITSESDKKFMERWQAKGYVFNEIKINEPKGGVCIACEG